MPLIPDSETAKKMVFTRDMAKDNKDDDKQEQPKARAEHHQAQPGPVIPQDTSVFENKPSDEELERRKAEVNKE